MYVLTYYLCFLETFCNLHNPLEWNPHSSWQEDKTAMETKRHFNTNISFFQKKEKDYWKSFNTIKKSPNSMTKQKRALFCTQNMAKKLDSTALKTGNQCAGHTTLSLYMDRTHT